MKLISVACLMVLLSAAGVRTDPRLFNGYQAQSQAQKRVIRMEITPANIHYIQIAAKEGEKVTFSHPDIGKFLFEPNFQKGKTDTVVVSIYDAKSPDHPKKLEDLKVPTAGARAESKTSPQFSIRILGVTEPK